MKAVVFSFELLVDAPEVAATIGSQETTWVFVFLSVPEAGTVNATNALVPRQLYKGFRVRNSDQFRSLWTVADVVGMPISV